MGWSVKVSRELSQTICKENTGSLRHSWLRTDNHSPGGRVKPPEATTSIPPRHWLQCQTDLAMSIPGQGHRIKLPFVLLLGPLRKSWVTLTHTLVHVVLWFSLDNLSFLLSCLRIVPPCFVQGQETSKDSFTRPSLTSD